jgi:hypothetical protein
MRSENETLGLGMVIGVTLGAAALLLALFFNMMAPGFGAVAAPPTSTAHVPSPAPPTAILPPTVTATFTPIPAASVTPNLAEGLDLETTPTADPMGSAINEGELSFSGPLSISQQVALYRASLNYVQTSVADSLRISKEINGVGYGDPTNICGPLAIAILRDAGIIDINTIPHDFWLLDPRQVTDQQLIEAAFPQDRWTHSVVPTSLKEVDWIATPLQPGDFLFIWHGSWGNFDHMLVVNHVDSAGRTYAVTNYGTPDGYMIAETMLYDPNDARAGMFHTWTKVRDAPLGSTGFGGYELWRLRNQ